MLATKVRPAGLEPATPGLGNRFGPLWMTHVRGNIEQTHSEPVRQIPAESAPHRAKLTSLLTSHPYIRRWRVRRRLYRLCRSFSDRQVR